MKSFIIRSHEIVNFQGLEKDKNFRLINILAKFFALYSFLLEQIIYSKGKIIQMFTFLKTDYFPFLLITTA